MSLPLASCSRSRTLSIFAALTLAACGAEDQSPDGDADTSVLDASGGSDASAPDAGSTNTSAPDASPDEGPQDTGAPDAGPDTTPLEDVGLDADVSPDPDESPDATGDDATGEDAAGEDATGEDAMGEDAAGEDAVGEDAAGEDTTSEDVPDAPCVPADTAAEALGVIDSVSTGAFDVAVDGDVTTWTVDASAGGPAMAASNPWLYASFADGKVDLTDVEALGSTGWNIAFKRAGIRINGGDSGAGGWLVTRIEGATFESAPRPGRGASWSTDEFVTDTCELLTEGRGTPLTAFGVWYDYNPETHAVAPTADVVWGLYDPATHALWKMQIDTWTGGVFTIRVSPF